MTRAVALTALITLLLAGCGGGAGNASPDSAIDLTLTLWPNGETGDSITWTLRCAPAGGDHPDPRTAPTRPAPTTPTPRRRAPH